MYWTNLVIWLTNLLICISSWSFVTELIDVELKDVDTMMKLSPTTKWIVVTSFLQWIDPEVCHQLNLAVNFWCVVLMLTSLQRVHPNGRIDVRSTRHVLSVVAHLTIIMTVLHNPVTHPETLLEAAITLVILIQIIKSHSDTLIIIVFQDPEEVVTQWVVDLVFSVIPPTQCEAAALISSVLQFVICERTITSTSQKKTKLDSLWSYCWAMVKGFFV